MEILYPNCSECVWRLNTETEDIYDKQKGYHNIMTDTYPNGCFDEMLSALNDAKDRNFNLKQVFLIEGDSNGGNWEYVEKCFEIAKRVARGKITEEKGRAIDEKKW